MKKSKYGVKVGDKVFHRNKYGDGTISAIDDKYITIMFGTEEKKFVFPDAFVQKYLEAPGFIMPKIVEQPKEEKVSSTTKSKPVKSPMKKSYTSSKEPYSRHGGGWVDDVWAPGLPSARYYRRKKR